MSSLTFSVQNQWGGNSAPWHPGGLWVIGGREGQPVIALDVTSTDGGKTLNGTMTYRGEGPIGFRATMLRAGSGNLHSGDKWIFRLNAGHNGREQERL